MTVTVEEALATGRTLALRLPAWCEDHAVTVNGNPPRRRAGAGRLAARHTDIPARRHRPTRPGLATPTYPSAPPRVDAVRGCVAIERGPMVYCVEQADQPGSLDPTTPSSTRPHR
ncbi:hypothetical protein [Streptomyces sp. NPDC051001]|uniref:hypothetical protein n=1 Tax=Streptomyces sp. NPDC051001 TaxID=3155795 RepID=UPI00341EDB4D